MRLIIIHKNKPPVTEETNNGDSLLRFALSGEPIATVILEGLGMSLPGPPNIGRLWGWRHNGETFFAIPEEWGIETRAAGLKVISYTEEIPLCFDKYSTSIKKRISWSVVSNGRYATEFNSELFNKVLAGSQADVILINAEPQLRAKQEKIRLSAHGKVAGFRRIYCDCAEAIPVPDDWPHHIFIKASVLDRLLAEHILPQSFSDFTKMCRSNGFVIQAINVAGVALDLETEEGLLNFCANRLSRFEIRDSKFKTKGQVSPDSRFVGKVLLGKDVRIGPKVIVAGPTVIGDGVTLEQGAVISSSIIGPKVCVPRNQLIQNRVVKGPYCNFKKLNRTKGANYVQTRYLQSDLSPRMLAVNSFRNWPRFSYARCLKRITDCIVAAVVLILFAPIIPFIVLAIKLTSSGPVFFKDKRQGLHGKEFYCLKFRSMRVGAEQIQDKLRIVSQVDGPQFKIEDDPRLTAVGRFLRDTYLDEIPQFFNVLLGQMSVVGPRPSPESENTLCPSWRDARLSVRPGVTGLWQIQRTRKPMRDFQEWIYYDTKYVRELSLKMDLWICWQTAKKMVLNFVKQF